MRIEYTLALCGALVFAAGCDETQRSASYGTSYGTTYGTYETPKQAQVMQSGTTYAQTAPLTPDYSNQIDSDRELTERVRRELNRYSDLASVSASIDVSAQNGSVILNGSVPTETQRRRIHDIARNTSGVIAVNDQLQIASPPPATYSSVPASTYSTSVQSDQTIANQVQQALYSHPVASRCAPNVRIMVQGGRVTLTGNLSNEQDRQVVDDVVRICPGVIGVTDQMQISVLPTGRIQEPTRVYAPNGDNFSLHVEGLNDADRDLAQRILNGMQDQTTVNRTWPGVTISVSNGRVTLQGTVRSFDEKRAIVESVRRASGPNTVYDEIRVVNQ